MGKSWLVSLELMHIVLKICTHLLFSAQLDSLKRGLRDALPSPKKETNTMKPPSLLSRQSMSQTSTIASSEELELNECRKQFRARPLPSTRLGARSRGMPSQQQHRPAASLTTPSPFNLRTTLRSESTRPPPPSTDDIELSRPFRARPLPNSSIGRGSNSTPYHIRALQQHEVAKQRREKLAHDVMEGSDGNFKARPVPRTTYVARPVEKPSHAQALTQPRPPRLSSVDRAEERRLFNLHAEEVRIAESEMKQMRERRQREMEEEELMRKRRSYADEGGFCFKAKQISIEYA